MTPRTAARSYDSFLSSNAPKPFQTTPTTGNREAHQAYLNLRLMDFMDGNVSLTPSYMRALVKYQKAVEPHVLEGSTIKRRDEERVLAEVEKIRRKSRSRRHVQKNGVIYKGRAQQQILEHTIEEQEYHDSITNAKIQCKIMATNKEYKKFLRGLEKKVKKWKETAIHVHM
jgi:hypothetical protein